MTTALTARSVRPAHRRPSAAHVTNSVTTPAKSGRLVSRLGRSRLSTTVASHESASSRPAAFARPSSGKKTATVKSATPSDKLAHRDGHARHGHGRGHRHLGLRARDETEPGGEHRDRREDGLRWGWRAPLRPVAPAVARARSSGDLAGVCSRRHAQAAEGPPDVAANGEWIATSCRMRGSTVTAHGPPYREAAANPVPRGA